MSAAPLSLVYAGRILAEYLNSGGKLIRNQENFAHVRRIRELATAFGAELGLSLKELDWLREAMAFSDVGKNIEWVNASFARRFDCYQGIERPRQLERSVLSERHLFLEGVMDWLRLYQREAKGPLRLRPPEAKTPTERLAPKLEVWGYDSFSMEGVVGGPATIQDRWQALRFIKIIFAGDTTWFPLGLYFHEVPGYAAAHAWGRPRRVLDAMFAHNGPETAALPDGSLVGEGLVPSFWGLPFFKPITGPYPLPIPGDRLAHLHTALDRFDQGGLVRVNDTFAGGVRKIFVDKITDMQIKPVQALREVLLDLPRQSQQQVHYLAHYGQVAGLEMVYGEIVKRLDGVRGLADLVDWKQSDAGDGYTIVLIDGTRLSVPQIFVEGSTQLTMDAAAQITAPLFAHLASLSERGILSGQPG